MVDASNKFQGDAGAGGLGTILLRNTNLMKLTVSVLGNFSSSIRNEYTYSPKLLGLNHPPAHPSCRSASCYHIGTQSHQVRI